MRTFGGILGSPATTGKRACRGTYPIDRPGTQEWTMIRKLILVLAAAGIYLAVKRGLELQARQTKDRAAEAQWANEGGANSPPSL